MDNTELHFVTYDTEDMWAKMMAAYVDAGGDVLERGRRRRVRPRRL